MEILGFIGFGEAAYHMAKGLNGAGASGILGYDVVLGQQSPYRETVVKRASEAGVALCASPRELLSKADVVIIAVPARYTAETAESALAFARPGQLFVDVTTALPDVKEAMETRFAAAGAAYVDSAMLGPLPVFAHKVPMTASGKGANRWRELMTPFGMSIEVVSGDAGAASRIKLVRSVFMKGLEALMVETFLFARRCGVEDTILSSISGTINNVPFEKTIARMVSADTIHAERRSFEVAESITLMKEVGIVPVVASAVRERLERSAKLGTQKELGGVAPGSLQDVFRIWEEKQYC